MANRLLAVEDWKRIYEAFQQVDLASYDFENLRRVFLDYVKSYYPEDFNDFIESSEYIALLDLIAFLGQNVSFRTDLNARENFIDTALRRDSVLRLSRMLGYNAKRNRAAIGLLKISSISVTDDIFDSRGENLKGRIIIWNDPANPNFYDQFTTVLSSTMLSNQNFGQPYRRATVQGIVTEEYQLNTVLGQKPVIPFSDVAGSTSAPFELVASTFTGQDYIYEKSPQPALSMSILYRNDGKGYSSSNNGFFFMFKQGELNYSDFTINNPLPNQLVGIDVPDINEDDVWLYEVDANGAIVSEWTKVPSASGTNVIFNSVVRDNRKIYSVISRENDQIDLNFSDGNFGQLPRGNFRCYYRSSLGESYVLRPNTFGPARADIQYINKAGILQTMTTVLTLNNTVNNSAPRESLLSIKTSAPQQFYTQNRMVNGEDYNIYPLLASQNIIKCKAINRMASGTNRYLDILDPTGRYSSNVVFGTDGALYKEPVTRQLQKSFTNDSQIVDYFRTTIEGIVRAEPMQQFYYANYTQITLNDLSWVRLTESVNSFTGYIKEVGPVSVGPLAGFPRQYISPGSIVKFTADAGKYFYNNKLLVGADLPEGATTYIYSRVEDVIGDGSSNGRGTLDNGTGPVVVNENIPTGAVLSSLFPKFVDTFPDTLVATIVNLINTKVNFGLGYDDVLVEWYVITNLNLKRSGSWSKTGARDNTNGFKDGSWLFKFEYFNDQYTITHRGLEYFFESKEDIRFYYDNENRFYNNGKILADKIEVLRVNGDPANNNLPYVTDIAFKGYEIPIESDGFPDTSRIKVSGMDTDLDLMQDNLQLFTDVVSPNDSTYLYFEKYQDIEGFDRWRLLVDQTVINKKSTLAAVGDTSLYDNGQVFYISGEDKFYLLNDRSLSAVDTYKARIGRLGLDFRYTHNVANDRRVDPSVTNIIDIYVLTRGYDNQFRQWLYLDRTADNAPTAPTDQALSLELQTLESVKSISDELIYHPVEYKVILGEFAEENLKGTLKVIKNARAVISDNEIKSQIVSVSREFFALGKFDMGETFYFTEFAAYIHGRLPTLISSIVLVPESAENVFGDIFQVRCLPNEIIIGDITVDNIQIVTTINSSALTSGS